MGIDWNQVVVTWYMWLSSLNSALAEPVRALSDGLGIPFVSAFLFGLLGTTAPCQLSTNFGAIAFLSRQPSQRGATLRATLAYIGAKMLVYTLLGLIVIVAGQQLFGVIGPYMDWARKVIGPTMILLGLAVLGVLRVRMQFGQGIAKRMQREVTQSARGADVMARVPREQSVHAGLPLQQSLVPLAATPATAVTPMNVRPGGSGGPGFGGGGAQAVSADATMTSAPTVRSSFLLGLGFSLAFCPTLALLFFGVTMTLAARSSAGFTFPAFFALGTALPLLLFVALALTSARAAARYHRGMRRANRPLRWFGGLILILVGVHDTLIYWFL